jgi:hypothetical protein
MVVVPDELETVKLLEVFHAPVLRNICTDGNIMVVNEAAPHGSA